MSSILLYKTDPKQPNKRLDYEQFKRMVVGALTTIPQGCSWSELKIKAGLQQKTPSPIWVNRMEDEKSLQRIRDPGTNRYIWKLQEYFASTLKSTLNGWTTKNAAR